MQHTKPESKEYASKQNYKKKKNTHTRKTNVSIIFTRTTSWKPRETKKKKQVLASCVGLDSVVITRMVSSPHKL